MSQKKYKQNHILNNNIPFFGLLCLCCVLYLGFIVDYWFLLFLALIPFSFKWTKVNWKQILILVAIFTTFVILLVTVNEFSLFNLIFSRGNPLRNSILNYFDHVYDQEVADFIKLVLFNVKSDHTWIFYKQTVDLGVVWLICISGFHVSLLSRVIKLIFKKIPTIGKYVNIAVVGFYSLLLNFSYASMRVLLKLSFDWIFKRFSIRTYNRLGFIGLVIGLLNPVCFKSYGFLLSFIVCTATYFIISWNLNNRIIQSVTINIFAFVATIPFVIAMNHKISLLTFINAFVFTYFSSFIFLYLFIFSWMPFMRIVHYGIMVASYVLVGNISFSNIFVYSTDWASWIIFMYYAMFFATAKVVYLIVNNNKI